MFKRLDVTMSAVILRYSSRATMLKTGSREEASVDMLARDGVLLSSAGERIWQTLVTFSHALHNDFSVNNGPHIRRWSHNIIL